MTIQSDPLGRTAPPPVPPEPALPAPGQSPPSSARRHAHPPAPDHPWRQGAFGRRRSA